MIKRLFQRRVGVGVDLAIALTLLVGASIGSTIYWRHIITFGPQPYYYQPYFEPAVMVACGKGFVVARPQVPEMVPFLLRQTDHFDCSAIRPDAPLGTEDLFQRGSWRYLLAVVGYTWRIFGVAWTALGPLFGVLFGLSIAAVYAIFRLGMGPLLSVAGAAAIAFSELHLKYLFGLRDYSKTPFTLALIGLLGAMVVGRPSWRRTLAIAAGYGAVLGIGYGFRTDFLIDVPPFVLATLFFLPGGLAHNLRLKTAAIVTCLVTFNVVGYPVISTQQTSRSGCQYHVVAMGFASSFNATLGVLPAPYDVSREYLDEYAFTEVTSHAARVKPGIGHIGFCEPEYGLATRDFLVEIARRFPADILVRAYAAVLRIVELPFSPVPGHDDEDGRVPDYAAGHGVGLAVVTTAIVVMMVADWRLGCFLLGFVLYFGGFPAIQFDHRHFFHLEFILWWAALFMVQAAVSDARQTLAQARPLLWRKLFAGLATVALCVAVLAIALSAARRYQQGTVRAYLDAYVAAPREMIPLAQLKLDQQAVRVSPHADPEIADFIVVDVNRSRCVQSSAVAFRYADPARRPYSRIFSVDRDELPGITQIFMPIYEGFGRLDFVDTPDGCVDGVGRVRDSRQFSLMLEAMLPPGWRRTPLYQRFGD